MNYKKITECRCCKNNNLIEILNLNSQPLANDYHNGLSVLDEYPLQLNLCSKCFHCQLSIAVFPDLMFKNYLYVSGTSNTLHEYFEWFADMVEKDINKVGSILDIACNDGTQLSKFKNRGWKTFGIDPATNLINQSKENADQIVLDYFNKDSIKKLSIKKFNVLVAQNVFAHVDNVEDFLLTCLDLMDDNTKLYIQTSQADMIENNQFDTIYHEHLSFFSTKSMKTLIERFNLKLLSVKRTHIHGTSYIFVISKTGISDSSVEESLLQEEKNGRYNISRYDEYKKTIMFIIDKFKNVIEEYKNKGYLIVGYGAAAKGNTFLNAAKVKLHYVIDDNKEKQNLLMPGSNSYIVDKSFINTFSNDVLFIPLAWNFYKEIKTNINNQVNKLKFKNKFNYLIYSYYPNPIIEKI